ncbi:MAG: sigma factor [Segetibacter sp.]
MTFEEIYKGFWQKVFRLCMGYVNDYDFAKDIAQETFITVWQQLPKFRNESAIGTWVLELHQIIVYDKLKKETESLKLYCQLK